MPSKKTPAKAKSTKKTATTRKPTVKKTVKTQPTNSSKSAAISKIVISKKVLLLLVGVTALGLLLFNVRGWLRVTVIPKTTGFFYADSVQAELNTQVNELGQPLSSLGYRVINRTPASCNLSVARNIHTEVYCTGELQADGLIPQDATAQAVLNSNAAKIESLLRANGWVGANTSLTSLVGNLTKGIDYTPDAAYQKTVGNVTCLFDSNTAFSSPHPAAISSMITCSRPIEVFGSPWSKNDMIRPY